ncbi:MAG: hemagglutinin repeat-containing protein, partial [Fusobacterium sp.]|nr:hemagglutinin repeat-containing protein [Fusobacterium sp.]
ESNNFTNTGTTSFGTGTNNLKVKNDIDNTGFIHSMGELNISANDIDNKGQLASVGNLNIDANNITNQALLYSSENIAAKFKGNFINKKADIYTGGNFTSIGNGDFENRLGDITSIGNIKIEADNIRNIGEITGSHKIVGKVSASESNINVSNEQKERAKEYFKKIIKEKNEGKYDKDEKIYLDKILVNSFDKVESDYKAKLAYINSSQNIELIAKEKIKNQEGNILANKNIDITAKEFLNISKLKAIETNLDWKAKTYTYRYKEGHDYGGSNENHNGSGSSGKYIRIVAPNLYFTDRITQYVGADKPSKISAGGKLNIAANKVGNGLFYENTINSVNNKNVNITPIVLNKKSIEEREALNTSNYIFIPDENLEEREKFESTNENIKKLDEVSNNNEFESENIEINLENSNVYKPKEKLTFEKEKINVTGKGLFKLNKIDDLSTKPGFSYLIETNLKFLDKSLYLGSEYFFKQLNFSPDRNIRLLGDSFYETRLINKTILEGTGRRYLKDFKTEKEQMKYLYDNGVKAQRDLNLSLGIALTKEQIDKLNRDIIWYIEEEVKGIKVLVPKLYLSKKTLESLKNLSPTLEAGNEVNIQADFVVNTGVISSNNVNISANTLLNKTVSENIASIDGRNISIDIEENLDNIGAGIKAKENLLIDSDGDILNTATYRTNTNIEGILKSKLENISEIEAGKNLVIKGKNIENVASNMKSGDLTSLLADNIKIGSLELEDKISMEYTRKDIKNVGSNLKSEGDILIKAKNDIDIKASDISADKNLILDAKDINISSIENSYYEKHGGGKNYTIKKEIKNIKSSLTGENIALNSNKDVNIKGTDILAKEDLNIQAGGDVNIVSATDSQYYEEMKSKKKRFGGKKSSHKIDYKETLVKSNILAGNDVNISSDKNILVTGSDIYALNNVNIDVKEDLTIESGLEGNSTVRQTTKTGLFKLSGKAKMEDNLKYTNAESVIGAEKDINLNSEKNVNVVASELTAGENINIKAKENVNILAADDKFKS